MAKKTREGRFKKIFKIGGNVEEGKNVKKGGMETEVKSKRGDLCENLEKEPFEVGQWVLIPRTNGYPSYAKITFYDKEAKNYRVEWTNSAGQQCYKVISEKSLKDTKDKYKIDGNYDVCKRVLIPRTNGDPTLAVIAGVPNEDGDRYTVIRKDPDKSVNGSHEFIKRLTKAQLDELNVPKNVAR